MSIKIDSLLRPYDGTGSWKNWYGRFGAICDFNKWETDEDRARYLMVFLEGTALRIVQQLPLAMQKIPAEIAKRLATAFSPSSAECHNLLIHRKLRKGESVEELYYDLCMLWKGAVEEEDVEVSEQRLMKSVLPFFLAAIPSAISTQLRLQPNCLLKVDKMLSMARVLVAADKLDETGLVGAAVPAPRVGHGKSFVKKGKKFQRRCGLCGDSGHGNDGCPIGHHVCFTCKKEGHRSVECPTKNSGVGQASSTGAVGGSKNSLDNKPWSGLLSQRK